MAARERTAPVERIERIGDLVFRTLSSTRPGATRTIVLVHGIGVSHRYLARLHAVLAETDTVVSVDLPGFGGLPKPGRSLAIGEMAAGLGEILDRAGLERVVLVGHSMGAQWVVELALQRPQLATHVVAIGPVTDDEHDTVLAQSVALGVDTLGEPLRGNVAVFSDYLFRCGPRWYLAQVRHMVDYRLIDRVAELALPLLVVRGGDDPIAGMAWCRRLRDSARDGMLVVMPGHRHLVQYTAPRAVASAVHAFVDEPAIIRQRMR